MRSRVDNHSVVIVDDFVELFRFDVGHDWALSSGWEHFVLALIMQK